MQTIELYIEGQRVELFKDESVSLTQSIQNVKDISKIFTDFSRTFTLPASKTNNKIFKHYYNFSIQNGFDGRTKKDALIQLNHLPFRDGKIKLEGVDLKNNVPYTYKITFFGSTVTLKDLLGEDKLQSLSELDELSLVYDASSINQTLQLNPKTNDIITPLITHTQRLVYDSTTGHSHGDFYSGNLYHQQGAGHEHGVLFTDLKYAIRIHKIIQAIENKYNINFSNNFFVDTNAPYYDLFMWLHRKKGNVESSDGVNQSLVNGWTPTSFDSATGTQMTYSYILKVSKEIISLYDIDLILLNPQGGVFKFIIQKDGQEIYKSSETSAGTSYKLSDNESFGTGEYSVLIESSSNITFDNITWQIVYRLFGGREIDYETGVYYFSNVFDFNITQQIPEMKIIDFLTGLFKMWNLTAYIKDDVIIVQELDEFYNNGNSYDISKYIDVEKSSVNVALPYREISFSYEDTGTILAKQHTQLSGKEWGTEKYKGDEGNLDGGLYSIKLPFSHLKNERLLDLNGNQQTSIMYGYYVDDNQESYIGKPLLFYPILQTGSGITPISFLDTPTSHTEINSYNVPSNSLSLYSNVSKVNINFFNEYNEYDASNLFSDTLFNSHYRNYISSVFNKKNRITKVTAYLPLQILINYTLADRFIINGNSYKINSITTNLENGKSELELLNDL